MHSRVCRRVIICYFFLIFCIFLTRAEADEFSFEENFACAEQPIFFGDGWEEHDFARLRDPQTTSDGVTPREFLQVCTVALEKHNIFTDTGAWTSLVNLCTPVIEQWMELAMRRDERCFTDPCMHQFCIYSLIYYAYFFFSKDELESDVGTCSQGFMPFYSAMKLVDAQEEMGLHSYNAKLVATHNDNTDGYPEFLAQDAAEWDGRYRIGFPIFTGNLVKEMFEARKYSCQQVRQSQLQAHRTELQEKFRLSEPENTSDIKMTINAKSKNSASRASELLVELSQEVQRLESKPRIAMMVAVANAPEVLERYQPMINIWQCYCFEKGIEFVMPTDDTILKLQFRAANWFRWYSAEKYLEYYDWLILVDPDEYVVPECWSSFDWNRDLLSKTDKHVIIREVFPPQTLNNGVVAIRNSPQGKAFLDLMLEKISWIQTFQFDQGAFDETILEVLGVLEKQDEKESYDSACLPWIFPDANGSHHIAVYSMCWWETAEDFAGPAGSRNSTIIEFVDPRKMDINQVVGHKGLSEKALIYHYAGSGKDWDMILQNFGLQKHVTSDCKRVFKHVREQEALKECVMHNEGVKDPRTYCPPPLKVC